MFKSYFEMKNSMIHESEILKFDTSYKTGTVYTPDQVSKYMVYMMMRGYLIQNHVDEITVTEFDVLLHRIYVDCDHVCTLCFDDGAISRDRIFFTKDESERLCIQSNKLFNLFKDKKIIDLACGTGNLLLAYIECLLVLKVYSHRDGSIDTTAFEEIQMILMTHVYACDINPHAIIHLKEILNHLNTVIQSKTKSTQFDRPKFDRIRHQDALIEAVNFDTKAFDFIIGNPPYIGEKGHIELFSKIKQTEFGFRYYEGKMDYFYFFIYRAQELLKASGSLCYLTSNYFFTADGAKKLRGFIKQHFPIGQVLDFTDTKVFKVKVHACIFTAHQKVHESDQDLHVFDELAHVKSKLQFDEIFDVSGSMSLVTDKFASAILHKVHQCSKSTLGDLYEVKQGIVSGADRVGDTACFVYKNHELVNIPSALKPYVQPFYKNSAIKHFSYEPNTEYSILYLNREYVTELELKAQLDIVKSHLKPFKSHLQKRREVENNVRHWYELTWPRDESIFSAEKIVAPQRARSNYFAYSKSAFYASADVYFMIPKPECNFEPKIMSLYLNSSIVKIYLYFKGKKKGKTLELYSTPLKKIPIPQLTVEEMKSLESILNFCTQNLNEMENSDSRSLINKTNALLFEHYKLTCDEINWINEFERMF